MPNPPVSTTGATSNSASPAPRLGRFEIRTLVGEGTQARVYRAFDPVTGRAVALKVPKADSDDQESRRRFLQEGRTAGQLRHPNLVGVYEAGEYPGGVYLAYEFVEGRPLPLVLEEGAPTPRLTAAWIRDLARALAYAHTLGIIHGDVKTANIVLDGDNRPRLLDFGMAFQQGTQTAELPPGQLCGTPAYMSPEQALGHGAEIGPASDQYSLGVVLYELLTGTRPFQGPPHILLPRLLEDPPLPPRRKDRRIPRDIEVICLKALEKSPAARYSSCEQFADDLDRWLHARPITARRLPPWERVARWARRSPRLAWWLSATAVLLAGITATSFRVAWRLSAEAEAIDVARQNHERNQRETLKISIENAALTEGVAAREIDAEMAQLAAREKRNEQAAVQGQSNELQNNLEAIADTLNEEELRLVQAERARRETRARLRETVTELLAQAEGFATTSQYVTLLDVSAQSITAGLYADARALLARTPVGLRGWEYSFLLAQCKAGVDVERRVELAGKTGVLTPTPLLRFSRDGQWLAIRVTDSRLTVVDVSGARIVGAIDVYAAGADNPILDFVFDASGRELAAITSSTARVWNVENLTPVVDSPFERGRNALLTAGDRGGFLVLGLVTAERELRKRRAALGHWPVKFLVEIRELSNDQPWVPSKPRVRDWLLRPTGEPLGISPDFRAMLIRQHPSGEIAALDLDTGDALDLAVWAEPGRRQWAGGFVSATNASVLIHQRLDHKPGSTLRHVTDRREVLLDTIPLAFSPDLDRAMDADGVWVVNENRLVFKLPGITQAISDWDSQNRVERGETVEHANVAPTGVVQWSPVGRTLAYLRPDGVLILLDAPANLDSLADREDAAVESPVENGLNGPREATPVDAMNSESNDDQVNGHEP